MAEARSVAPSTGAAAARIVARTLAWSLALGIAGCASEPTRIVVVTDSDLAAPSPLAAVRFSIDSREIGGVFDTRVVALGPGEAALPLVLPIVHDGGPLGPIVITAEGLNGGVPIVERSAELSFVPGRSLVLVLPLEASCRVRSEGEGRCDQGRTCAEGTCVPRAIDASTLPEWSSRDALPSPAADAAAPTPPRDDDDDGGDDDDDDD